MVAIGLISGIIPLFVFVVSWIFGLSITFLKLVGLSTGLGLIAVSAISYFKHKTLKEDKEIKFDRNEKIILLFIGLFLLVNLIGAFAPEVGFDALWYHLTIPKIFIQLGKIDFIPGGLYYYSAMPKLTEIWYLISLVFDDSGSIAKIIHYLYGLGCLILTFRFATKLMSRKYALVAVLATVSALTFCWESGSAYIDLAWTFYSLLALYLFHRYAESETLSKVVLIGIASGLAIGTKLPAFISAAVLFMLIVKSNIKHSFVYLATLLLIASPWLIFSWRYTGNPIYPIFTNIYPHENILSGINLTNFITTLWKNLTWPQDPFSIFVGFLAVTMFLKGKVNHKAKWLWWYLVINYVAWYLLFRSSGSRFLLPLLPVWLLCCLSVWSYQADKIYQKILFCVLIVSCIFNLGYRVKAVSPFVSAIINNENRQNYLLSRLNFDFGDFYDRDKRVKEIVGDNQVLVYGYHNLFYADFKFTHESQTIYPYMYRYWLSNREITNCPSCRLIYTEKLTKVFLYSLSEFAKI